MANSQTLARAPLLTVFRKQRAQGRAGITQAALAARVGSTQPAIARLEAGGVTPNLATLRRIAAALSLELVVQLRTRRAATCEQRSASFKFEAARHADGRYRGPRG